MKRPLSEIDLQPVLATAIEEARAGFAEGGIPIGAALYTRDGVLLGRGHNRRVQHGDPSGHGETDAFRNAGRHSLHAGTAAVSSFNSALVLLWSANHEHFKAVWSGCGKRGSK
jgi:creatinine deaminase